MTKILIVDDEAGIREVIREYAQLKHHFHVTEASNGQEALNQVMKDHFDLIVLDIMMPVMDGFTFVREMRKHKMIPVIMLSARGQEYDKLMGFELGIDDYVVKPFSPNELMARINAVLKRHAVPTQDEYQFAGLTVDVLARNVFIDQKKVTLTPKEFDLLVFMIRNKNTALSREVLLENVWNYSYFGDDRTIDTHIKMLRRNLGPYRDFIVTVRGLGYKFEV
jgi:two-component system, OmpR family, response regulator ResD